MILVNSGAFLSISSWFCELTELIFVMIPYISSTGYPPTTQGIMGRVQVANKCIVPIKIHVCCSLNLAFNDYYCNMYTVCQIYIKSVRIGHIHILGIGLEL